MAYNCNVRKQKKVTVSIRTTIAHNGTSRGTQLNFEDPVLMGNSFLLPKNPGSSYKSYFFYNMYMIPKGNSRAAKRNHAGLITQRCVDRNHALLSFCLAFLRVELIWIRYGSGVCVF
ncbi:hypothetical protein T05_13853 [Trichinella murrelli]|uniref:Uncharacterized protein n=1 Tax=Trichinella murrelli TaxID=144512 RepID=A0A0V0T817_9BILA|nr:hypothetical protein T05_13853 [Trichinella murrelli]